MAIRTVRQEPDDALHKRCKEVKEVTGRIKELVADMIETMHEAGGVGLAAPQVGILKRVFVVDTTGEEPFCCINPEILSEEGEQTGYEGCLSLPGYSGKVTRAKKVKIRALNAEGESFEMEAEDLVARAILHEYDHLEGIMYTEKMIGELVRNEDLTEEDFEEEEA
ncbi:MAG: peptide deformylase [Lachnospiraceae bacterium]|nr:peptide deformylase [Lachnospiraceae bacterium]